MANLNKIATVALLFGAVAFTGCKKKDSESVSPDASEAKELEDAEAEADDLGEAADDEADAAADEADAAADEAEAADDEAAADAAADPGSK